MQTSGIYQIRNTTSGKVYIGSSIDVANRFVQHRESLNSRRHHNAHLQSAWVKYGTTAFVFEVLEETLDLARRESFWIDSFPRSSVYNMIFITETGARSPDPEIGRKISLAVTGKRLGRRLSDVTRAKMSAAARLRLPMSAETGEKIRQSRLGSSISDETKRRMSETHRAQCQALTPEQRERPYARGRTLSVEAIERRTKSRRDRRNGSYF